MKTLLMLFLLMLSSVNCFSQQDTISAINAKDYMNKEVVVFGKAVSLKSAYNKRSPNFINLDKPYPNNVFTVVIFNDHLKKLNIKLEDLKGKVIYVKGKVSTYKNDPKQIPQILNPISIEIKKEK